MRTSASSKSSGRRASAWRRGWRWRLMRTGDGRPKIRRRRKGPGGERCLRSGEVRAGGRRSTRRPTSARSAKRVPPLVSSAIHWASGTATPVGYSGSPRGTWQVLWARQARQVPDACSSSLRDHAESAPCPCVHQLGAGDIGRVIHYVWVCLTRLSEWELGQGADPRDHAIFLAQHTAHANAGTPTLEAVPWLTPAPPPPAPEIPKRTGSVTAWK
mmetsp:Transcript_99029/g.263142  ORF Transcript_99029/g.263142 Transcript_99029/m.263142 type:complete len:215 (-) Transcript_99029:42-686(-)